MASQPAETNISQFMDITARDRVTAINYLRGTGDDLWRAIDMAFNGEPPGQPAAMASALVWNEGDWNKDRNGDFAQDNIPSFQIDVADDMTGYPQTVAPSRPPSRNSQRSGNSGANMRDASMSGRTSRMDVDRPGQETGVVQDGVSTPYFGPATRPHYNPSDWAMTVAGTNESRPPPDPPAPERKRDAGHIAFLKSSTAKEYLPGVLTILNAIPASHNALLLNTHVFPDYGYDSEWWKGGSIKSTRPEAAEDSPGSVKDQEILQETQRLMAFLDLTDRSYGSTDALLGFEVLADIMTSTSATQMDLTTNFEKFLAAWRHAAYGVVPKSQLKGILDSTALVNDQIHRFYVLPADLGKDMPFKPQTLYDVLDAKLFVEEWPNIEDDVAALVNPAKVLILKLEQQDSASTGLDIDIPAVWYADRYLKDNIDITQGMRQEIARAKAMIQSFNETEQELSKYECNGKMVDPLQLLEVSMKAFRLRTSEEKEVFPKTRNEEAEDETRHREILKRLQKALDSVREKLDELKTQRERAVTRLRRHTQYLTEPTKNSDVSPKARYWLRGIATNDNVTYVLQSPAEPLVKDDDWTEQAQWWKIGRRAQDTSKSEFVPERIKQSEVLAAARSESKEVVLVYACDEALAASYDTPVAPLENFVKRDNHAFKQEVERAESQQMTDLSDSPAAWAAATSNTWDDSQDFQHQPPPYDWSEKWGGTYTFEKTGGYKDSGSGNATSTESGQVSSSTESWQVVAAPDSEMKGAEMKEKGGSSLVGKMMSEG